MSWYYAQSDKQVGPISDADFQAHVQSGVITDATLVWRDGMANWQPYQQVRAGTPSGIPAGAIGGAAPLGATGQQPGANEVVCAECRQIFSRDNAINYGTVWVCAACKPLFVQKLKEGAMPAHVTEGGAALHYAGFWIRFVARFIDGLIATVVLGIPSALVMWGLVGSQNARPGPQLAMQALLQLVGVAFAVGYNTFFIGKYAATPGKMAVGVKVVAPDGSRITMMRAFGRAWADYLSSLTCAIGYIIAAFDAEKRALHDHICTTRVVYK